MRTHGKFTVTFLAGLIVWCCLLAIAMANGPTDAPVRKRTDVPALTVSYTWHDGQQMRTVWLNPEMVVEFAPGAAAASAMRRAYPDAAIVAQARRGARIWRIPPQADAQAAVDRLRAIWPKGIFSPVFHDAPATTARIRALPGNIIVYLDPSWSADKAERWVAERGLTIVRQLEIATNVFVLKTGPGLEALQRANSLYASGEVIAAFPDWWLETEVR